VIALEEANHSLETQRATLQAEQDTFIAFLMEDHQKGLVALEQQLSQAKQSLERQAVLSPVIAAPAPSSDDSELRRSLTQAEEHIATLREQLENAYREVDESRSDGWRLQEERDEAIRNTDDIRNELLAEVDGSRDEIAKLEQSLDEANRALEDARDEAREETSRILEELESARNECDERRAEVTRLRERLEGGQSDYRASVPPPPPQNDELELARAEAKVVRKQLIDTKRELSRLSRELELARAQRGPLHRVTPTGGFRPNTRTGTTQPGLNSGGEGPGSRRSGEPPGSKRTVTGSVGKRPDDRKPGTE
jgi:DNA repair exonuclease SbcCD ATPase subunit